MGEEGVAVLRRSSVVLALFLTYALGIAAPCYCATHVSGGEAAAESHSCCQSDATAAKTSVRSLCCCDDREQARVTIVIPDPQVKSAPVVATIIDSAEPAPTPGSFADTILPLEDAPPLPLLRGSTPDLRAPPTY
jgi:hypothetical protein